MSEQHEQQEQDQQEQSINEQAEIETFPSAEFMLQQTISFGKFNGGTKLPIGALKYSAPSIVNNDMQPINIQLGDFLQGTYFTMPFGLGPDGPRDIIKKDGSTQHINSPIGEHSVLVNLPLNDDYTSRLLKKIEDAMIYCVAENATFLYKDVKFVSRDGVDLNDEQTFEKKMNMAEQACFKILDTGKGSFAQFKVKVNSNTGSRNETKLYRINTSINNNIENQIVLDCESWEEFKNNKTTAYPNPLLQPLRGVINVSIANLWSLTKTAGVVIYAKSLFLYPSKTNYSSPSNVKLVTSNNHTSSLKRNNDTENSLYSTTTSTKKSYKQQEDIVENHSVFESNEQEQEEEQQQDDEDTNHNIYDDAC